MVQIFIVMGVLEQERKSYYEGAIRSLQFVEGRRPTGRRFGPDADARWKSFKGDLQTADRIDLLIRDADAEWPCAFGARAVYDLQAVAEDEAFGSEWQPLDPVLAEEMWRGITSEPSPESPAKVLGALAKAWNIELTPVDIGTVAPTDSFVIAGPSAIAAAILAFTDQPGLDWHQQVRVIATPPSHRQLAATGAAIVNAGKATQLVSAAASKEVKAQGSRLLSSADAGPADLEAAQKLTQGA